MQLDKRLCPSVRWSVSPLIMIESKTGKTSVLDTFCVCLCVEGEDWGVDAAWAPRPNRSQCYCGPASLVLRNFATEPQVSIGVTKVFRSSGYGPVEEFDGAFSSVTVSGFSLKMYFSCEGSGFSVSAIISYIACGHFA